ncbi:MAG: BamA/TamA family outer membrane protein [Candidatus Aminicenantes bacterium]|nr:BamA/TamA family outer membrane protein [Candidatus Aminicenantes bacterium]
MRGKTLQILLSVLIVHSFATIIPSVLIASVDKEQKGHKKSLSVFPYLMYDTDIGVGYGGKAKFVNYLSKKESFDFIVFNSSKGERWYVFIFSVPDIEIRQGKKYPFSFDLRAEYDKYPEYYFYGMGPDAEKADQTTFTFEKKELQLTLGKGFSPRLVMEGSYVFKSVRYFDVAEDKPFTETLEEVGEQFSPFVSLVIRYDTSDSQIHPKKGFRLLFQNDFAAEALGNRNARYYRYTLDFRKYTLLFGRNDVLAFRTLVQKIEGKEIPLFEMSVLGGGSMKNAMRGYKLNRFNDKGKFLLNIEYRYPIWKKLGGNIFVDGGSVWHSGSKVNFRKVAVDIGWGLRYYLQNFVARFDMGFSKEGVGIYFNFGHIF